MPAIHHDRVRLIVSKAPLPSLVCDSAMPSGGVSSRNSAMKAMIVGVSSLARKCCRQLPADAFDGILGFISKPVLVDSDVLKVLAPDQPSQRVVAHRVGLARVRFPSAEFLNEIGALPLEGFGELAEIVDGQHEGHEVQQ